MTTVPTLLTSLIYSLWVIVKSKCITIYCSVILRHQASIHRRQFLENTESLEDFQARMVSGVNTFTRLIDTIDKTFSLMGNNITSEAIGRMSPLVYEYLDYYTKGLNELHTLSNRQLEKLDVVKSISVVPVEFIEDISKRLTAIIAVANDELNRISGAVSQCEQKYNIKFVNN